MKRSISNLIIIFDRHNGLLLFSIVSVLFGLTFSYAHAYTFLEQPDFSETSNALGSMTYSGGIAVDIGQTLGNQLNGTITTTTIRFSTGSGLSSTTIGIQIECYGTDATYNSANFNAGCSTGLSTIRASSSMANTSFDFTTNLTFIPGNYYRIGLACTANCPGGTNPNVFTYGSLSSDAYLYGDFTAGKNLGDLYFSMQGNANGKPFMAFPINTQNVTEFPAWFVNLSDEIANGNTSGIVGVAFGNSTSGLIYRDEKVWSYITDLTGTQEGAIPSIYKSYPLSGFRDSTTTKVWYARPYFLSGATTTYGDLISFNVKPEGTLTTDEQNQMKDVVGQFIYSSSTPEHCNVFNDLGGCLVNAGSAIGRFLFYPGKIGDSVSALKSSIFGIKNVFPFSTIFNYQQILQSQLTAETASSSANLIYSIPAHNGIPTTTFTVLTPTTLQDIAGTNIKNQIFTAIKSIIYLSTAVSMILMIR